MDVDAAAALLGRQAEAGGGEHVDLVALGEILGDVPGRHAAAAAERRVLVVDDQYAHARLEAPVQRGGINSALLDATLTGPFRHQAGKIQTAGNRSTTLRCPRSRNGTLVTTPPCHAGRDAVRSGSRAQSEPEATPRPIRLATLPE